MNALVIVKKENKLEIPVTTSKVIAEGTKNTHDSIQKLISRNENDFLEFGKLGFEIRPSAKNQPEKIYFLNEDQTLLLITYMRNNDIVRTLKIALIKEFRAMKDFITERHSQEWIESRKTDKEYQKQLGDVIKKFTEYAQAQGSNNYNRYYTSINKLANSAVGIEDGNRDMARSKQLMYQVLVMDILRNTIEEGVNSNIYYKDVYKLCKDRVNSIFTHARIS